MTLIFLASFLCFSFLAYNTLMSTKINGAQYNRIIQGKDLIADILPPPEYIIEANLVPMSLALIWPGRDAARSHSFSKVALRFDH